MFEFLQYTLFIALGLLFLGSIYLELRHPDIYLK